MKEAFTLTWVRQWLEWTAPRRSGARARVGAAGEMGGGLDSLWGVARAGDEKRGRCGLHHGVVAAAVGVDAA